MPAASQNVGKDVEKLHGSRRGFAGRAAGQADHHRHAAGDFEHRIVLRPLAFFAQVIAVIAEEDDDGLVAELEAIDGFHDAAELPIDEGDGGVVGFDHLAGGFGRGVAADEQIAAAERHRAFGKSGRHGRPRLRNRAAAASCRVVQVEQLGRRGRRAVRLGKTDGQEERLVLQLFEQLDGPRGGSIVAVRLRRRLRA